ncbi:EAL domain-containing protein [Neptuniibacter sp. QD57_21]|uniref:bifunctional diguanylate cyclase/phosphodiesterase n=1 Tax=Neptuniibacter sp. QD57_21 TaxID=3398213 RepID=UPI0039F5F8C5
MATDHSENVHINKPIRGLLALVVLPLFLIAIGGIGIYLNLASKSETEARNHSQNITQLLASQTDAFIRNRTHAVALMAGEQQIIQYLLEPHQNYSRINNKLKRYCRTLQASICYIMNNNGVTQADNREPDNTLVGKNYAFRPYFQQAIQGIPTVHLALGVTTKKRGLYFSHPIVSEAETPIGVAIIKFLPDQIEERFHRLPGNASLIDPNGVVFASNNETWLYKTLFPLSSVQQKQVAASRQFGDTIPEHLGFSRKIDSSIIEKDEQLFIYENAPLEELPGWQISFLLEPEQFQTSEQITQHQIALSLIGAMFFLTLVAIKLLYRQLRQSLGSTQRYQHELEQSEQRLQRFEEVTSEAIFIHNSQGIVDLNRRAEELFGYSYQDFIKLDPQTLFTPESLPTALEHARNTSEQPYQAVIITKQQEEIPVVITGRRVLWHGEKARVASFRDIRKRVETQKKLSASEDRFRQLSDLVAEGLLIYSNHKIIDVNQALCRIFATDRETLIASSLGHLFNKEISEEILELEQTDKSSFEITLQRGDGSTFPAEISSASMLFDDDLFNIVSIRDISRQKEQEEHILYQAQYDLLTNIPNRVLARDRAEQAIKKMRREGRKLALMFIDLDDFKKVNDSLGHDIGDQLLQQAVERLQSCLAENHTLARHGGDEFLIILEDLEKPEQAELTAELILEKFSQPFVIQSKQLIVTASIGIAIFPDDAVDFRALLRAADIGMYKAKKDGRNRFHYYTQEMNDVAVRQLELDNCLRSAIANDELSLAFQPLICGLNNDPKIVGAEALLRWHSPKLGEVSPAEFVPLTEQTGLIIPIGRWVLKQACKQAQRWIEQGHAGFTISVNVSPRQFKGNDFIKDLNQALEYSGLSPENLKLEVTEGLIIEASSKLDNTLQAISDMGIQISMDDFGTGYSSLNYLQRFPFDNLKIDRSFIRELATNPDSQILVSATIAMAHQLGLSVTAEGIETEEQKEYLHELRCDYLQGYLLGKPVTAHMFSEAIERGIQKNPDGDNA